MGTKWTKEQTEVLESTEGNLLVSAAAGAGKTAVLVERIIRIITDDKNPVDIDRFVIMTFTKAAAAQMRTKLSEALEKKIEANPLDKNLMRQYRLISNASICTIDSFCVSLVRDYFHELDIDPTFRIADEAELGLLRADCMEKVLEAEYEEGTEEFIALSESYSDSRSDKALEKIIFDLADKALSQPWPMDWLDSLGKVYHIDEKKIFLESPTVVKIVEYAKGEASVLLRKLQFADKISQMQGGPVFYDETIGYLMQFVKGILDAGDYEEISELLESYIVPKLSGKKCDDADLRERAKNIIEEVRKSITELKEKYFFSGVDELIELIKKAEPFVNALVEVTERYLREFEAVKKEKNVIDFSDSEHFALRILLKKEDGEYVRTAVAKELQSRYSEIIIDEYQDSNYIQECIANAIAGDASERPYIFTVGDVKQSIYKFRNACPELFVRKQEQYAKGEDGKLIVLDRNFRSRAEVLESANALFKMMMISEVGGITYDDTCSLKCGIEENPAMDPGYRTELLISEQITEENEESALEFEAGAVARRIKKLVAEERLPIRDRRNDENILRPAGYGDIVILLRSMKNLSDVYAKVLEREGIPCITDSRSGFFKTAEVTLVTYYLALLDNPRQDIPLTAVLHSKLCGLTAEELAQIRIIAGPARSYWDAVKAFMERINGKSSKDSSKQLEDEVCGTAAGENRADTVCGTAAGENRADAVCGTNDEDIDGSVLKIYEKLQRFFEIFNSLRAVKNDISVAELITLFYDKTHFDSYVAAMPDGAAGKANLDMLLGYAANYEKTGYSGLFSFIRYLDQLKAHDLDYGEAGSEQAVNAVHIMSIHQSKGLEFPVVIIGNLGKSFNEQDSRARLIIHSDYGVGLRYVDLENRVKYPSLYEAFIKLKMNEEMVAEELRLLYVAMTRAKDKLIMAGTVGKKYATRLHGTDWKNYPEEKISYNELLGFKSYIMMTYPAACRNAEVFDIFYDYGNGATVPDYSGESEAPGTLNEEETVEGEGVGTLAAGGGSKGEASGTLNEEETAEGESVGTLAAVESSKSEAPGTLNEEETVEGENTETSTDAEFAEEKSSTDSDLVRRLTECRNRVYPYRVSEEVPVKLSVSDLKLQSMLDEFGEEIFEETREYETGGKKTVPDFLKEKEEEKSGTGYGTLVHKCMQFIDLGITDTDGVREFLDSMVREGRISVEERRKLRAESFIAFLNTDVARRMKNSEEKGGLFREQQFMLGMKAYELENGFAGNDTLVPIQGVIDVMFIEDGEIVILDYKTDHVDKAGGEEELVKRYKTQLDYYGKAAEKLLGLHVKEKIIYSFSLGKVVVS